VHRSWLMLSFGMVFAVLWASLVAYGYLVGFRAREARREGNLIAKGAEAKRFGILLMCVGGLLLLADVVLLALYSGLFH
jgi:hypothetical protein